MGGADQRMNCKICKAENREESLYCGDCGARIQLLTPFQKKVWAAVAAAAVLSLAYWVFWLRPAQQAKEQVRAAAGAKAAAAIKWVTIPGGSFSMGSGKGDEGPVHSVTIKSFQMAKTLVTVAQYRACVDAGACTAPDGGAYCNFGVSGRADHPVNCVDWNQAKTFSKWVGGRLPSEAEWEYAARSAGKDWKYPWGDAAATCETAVIRGCTSGGTAPVCSKPAGNTRQGLCDMAGNAWEWVQDWYHDSYNGAPTDGSAWESPTGSRRVNRGGSWYFDADLARSAYRGSYDPGRRYNYLGFRPARRGQ